MDALETNGSIEAQKVTRPHFFPYLLNFIIFPYKDPFISTMNKLNKWRKYLEIALTTAISPSKQIYVQYQQQRPSGIGINTVVCYAHCVKYARIWIFHDTNFLV